MWNAKHLSLDKIEHLIHLSNNAHIILTTETWWEQGPGLSLPGYTCMSTPKHFQHHLAQRPSGGIAAYVREDIAHYVSQWRPLTECTHMWLRINPTIGLHRDLFLCLCYLPPNTSTYYTSLAEHPLTVIAREAHTAGTLGNVCLAGDFNARTGTAPDWPDCSELADLSTFIEGLPDIPPQLPPPRQNQDNKIKTQGKMLLQLCQECQLYIVNGRVPGDLTGELTCFNINNKGASTVDYFLADPELFARSITDMYVLPRPHMAGVPLSDHCPLTLTLHTPLPRLPCGELTGEARHIPRFLYRPTQATAEAYASDLGSDPQLACPYLDSLPTLAATTTLQQRIMHHIAHHPKTPKPQNPIVTQ